jgi:hypothetical protein
MQNRKRHECFARDSHAMTAHWLHVQPRPPVNVQLSYSSQRRYAIGGCIIHNRQPDPVVTLRVGGDAYLCTSCQELTLAC